MEFEKAKKVVLEILQSKGRAKNSDLIKALGGDSAIFELVKEDLIFDDLAEDKKGAGLIYIGPPSSTSGDQESHDSDISTQEVEYDSVKVDQLEAKHRIFISYGRKDATDLAIKLRQDFQNNGHDVWLDQRKMEPGISWEHQIEQAILDHDVFIALLSPHAVRRPDGVCLDEISMARYNSRKIIPAMVLMCPPPLGIYRLDWVDFQNWSSPGHYEKAFARLLQSLGKESVVEGVHARIFSKLNSLDFGVEIARLTKDFTGREWLFHELDQWLENDKSRVFFITGDPGTGKSAVMAWLTHKDPRVAAYHFCVSSLADSRSPHLFVKSLAAQLATQLPDYRTALEAINIEQADDPDPGTVFRRMLADPLRSETPEKPVLIVIDALDEGFGDGVNSIPKLLRDRLSDLPSWVKIVVSSRKEPEILDSFSQYEPHEIEATREENLRDVTAYIEQRLREKALANLVDEMGLKSGETANLIAEKAQGNFLYVTQAIEEIKVGRLDPRLPDSFPDSLVGFYQRFFERVFPDSKDFADYRPLLEVICAAYEPLTAEQIGTFLGKDPFDVELDLENVASFFPERQGSYRAYHKSVVDWLSGAVGRSKRYRINIKAGHQRIADSCCKKYQTDVKKMSIYAITYLPRHLSEANHHGRLATILTDLLYIEAKCATVSVFELIKDYNKVLESFPDSESKNRSVKKRLNKINSFLIDLYAYSNKELDFPPKLDSCELWSGAETEEEIDRFTKNISSYDKLKLFSNFVKTQSHIISQFHSLSGICIQEALNMADSGPVFEAALEKIRTESEVKVFSLAQSQKPKFNPYPELLKTMDFHEDIVTSISICADGSKAISSGRDGKVAVWDLIGGEVDRTLIVHEGAVNSVTITPDGKFAASSGDIIDRSVLVWDLESYKKIGRLHGHKELVTSFSLAPNARFGASACDDNLIRVWDIASEDCIQVIKGHVAAPRSVWISPNGKRLVSTGLDRLIRVWDIENNSLIIQTGVPKVGVYCVSSTPDMSRICFGCRDGQIRFLDLHDSGSLDAIYTGGGQVYGVSLSVDGRLVISANKDGKVRLWDAESKTCLRSFSQHSGWPLAVHMTPDGKFGLSGGTDSTIRLWDLEPGAHENSNDNHYGPVKNLLLDTSKKAFISGGWDGSIRVWDSDSGSCEHSVQKHNGPINAIACTTDCDRIVSAGHDGGLRIWRTGRSDEIELEGHSGPVTCITITDNNTFVVSGGKDRVIKVWDLIGGNLVQILNGHNDRITSVCSTPDEQLLLSSSWDGYMRIWSLEDFQPLKAVKISDVSILCTSMSSDGLMVAVGCWDGTVSIVRLGSQDILWQNKSHTGPVEHVKFLSDGSRVLSAGEDGFMHSFDVDNGAHVGEVIAHDHPVVGLSISHNDVFAATAGEDNALKLWDLKKLKCVSVYVTERSISAISQLSANGKISVGTKSGDVKIFTILNI